MNINIKKTTSIIIGLIIFILVGLGIYYSVNKKSITPDSGEKIKIGISAPLTGEVASWGQNAVAGAELAVREINSLGGINGRLIELIIEDDKCVSVNGVNSFNKLINVDEVTAIAGPICSPVGGAALPIAQQNKVPVVIITASNPMLTKIGDYIFRIYPSDSLQGKIGADFIFNTLGKRKVAVIYVKNDWGQGIKEVFINRFKELGGEIVYEDNVLQESNDLRTQLSKVKNSGAEALYFPVYPANAISGFKQIKELGLNIPIVGGDSFGGEEVVKSEFSDGVIYTIPKINNPEEFIAKIKSLPGKENLQVSIAAPLGYDAIKILAKVIQKVGTNKKLIRDELANLYYQEGVSNPIIEFDENGDLKEGKFEIKIIKDKTSIDYSR